MPTGVEPQFVGVIDYGQHNSPCQCPTAWWGICPPPCPVHNPARTVAGGGVPMPYTFTPYQPEPQRLSDADVERIAERVAEKINPKGRG